MRSLPGLVLWLVAMGCQSDPEPVDPPSEPVSTATVERPHVVLVIGCTVRKELLGPYGAPAEHTPFLSQLAQDGTVVEDLIATSSWTRPTHVAMLTGQFAEDLGMVEPGDGVNSRVLAEQVTTLAERFGAAGYATIGGTANPNLNAVFGMGQGFDRYHEGSRLWREIGTVKADGATVVDALLTEVDEVAPDEPLYLQVTLVESHQPHDTTSEQAKAWQQPGEPIKVARYRGDQHRLDGVIARLHAGLLERGHTAEDTLFIFVADHGEGLLWPDRHMPGHGHALAESMVQVPWILSGPGIPEGARLPGLSSQLDVAPTVLGLAGLPEAPELPGHDLSGPLRAGEGASSRPRAFASTFFKARERYAVYTPSRACEEGRPQPWQRTDATTTAHCWDRATDPHARAPLPADEALLDELRHWKDQHAATAAAWPHGRDAELDAAPTEALKALGYIDGPP